MHRRRAPQDRALIAQACDGCRLRKVRCRPAGEGQCERCSRLLLDCTFALPCQTRGPKKRDSTYRPSNEVPHAVRRLLSSSSRSPAITSTSTSTAHLEPTPTYALDWSRGSTHTETSADHVSPRSGAFATDCLCARDVVLMMLEDYLQQVYPLIPVVHRPSFHEALSSRRETEDANFLDLLIAMCAVSVGILPSRFAHYRDRCVDFPFESRKSFVGHCYALLHSRQQLDYYDNVNYQKFAKAYLMDIALFQTGHGNLARMAEVEALQLARLLALHQIEEYEGLNKIETQLRKKGFWLLFYSFVHSDIQRLRGERLAFLDPIMLESVDLEALMPWDVDDEAIFEDHILARTSNDPCLTTSFNIHSEVFWTANENRRPSSATRPPVDACHCKRSRDPQTRATHLQERLQDLKYTLHTVPPQLRQWNPRPAHFSADEFVDPLHIVISQFGAMRANLHVTHLWLQSMLMDQLETLLEAGRATIDPSRPLATADARWSERENLSSQLLHVLHAIPQADLEPNGLHLAYKVRDVAVGLLSCPHEPHEPASLRAAEYVREFTEILSRLDSSETVNTTNLQTWVDTDRERGMKSREDTMMGNTLLGWG